MKPQIYHLRFFEPDAWRCDYTLPCPQGGVTVALDNDGKNVRFGVAICSVQDNYDRKKGVEIAVQRLTEEYCTMSNYAYPDGVSRKIRLRHLLMKILNTTNDFSGVNFDQMERDLYERYGGHCLTEDSCLHLGIVGFGHVCKLGTEE